MVPDNPENCVDPTGGQSVVLRQLYAGVQPELCFAAGMLDVHVGPWLFAGEEVQAVSANSQNRRTHDSVVAELAIGSHQEVRVDCILGQPREEGFCGPAGNLAWGE